MKLLNISGRNFMTLGEVNLPLADRGLLLIQGVNDDDTSANSNGAGKSSVVELICWVLYGETSRGLSADEVINDAAGKDCAGFLTIEDDDGSVYQVARYRKDSKEKNKVTLHRIDVTPPVDATKGTDKETQQAINKLIGCELEVFKAAVYAAQEEMPDLPGMTDKQLKLLVEEAAGIVLLQEAYVRANAKLQDEQKRFTAADTALANLRVRADAVQRNVGVLESAATQWEDSRKAAIQQRALALQSASQQLAQLRAEASAMDESVFRAEEARMLAEINALRNELSSFATYDQHINVARQELQQAELKINTFSTDLRNQINNRNNLAQRAQNVSATVGQPCRECGKPHTQADLANVYDALIRQVQALDGDIAQQQNEIPGLDQCRAEAAANLAKVEAGRPDPTAINARLTALHGQLNQTQQSIAAITHKRQQVTQAEAQLQHMAGEIKQLQAAGNPNEAAAAKERNELASLQAQMTGAELEMIELSAKVQIAKDVAAVFSPAGIRAHILDTVTPFLNDRTSQYLGTMSDGNITATWQTLSRTAKGEVREKFTINVVNATGAKKFAGMSGGEKRKVRIACALALQDLVASRASKPLQIWLGDEIDHALDASALERLMTILEQKARERGTVLIISHNDLADWCSNIVTVRKSGGISKLEA